MVTVFIMQLWDVIEVHAIDTSDEGEWNKNCSYNSEHFHHFIHFVTNGGHVHIH